MVVPVLRAAGIARLDAMVLTHEDIDHIGGALTVLETFEVGALRSSLPAGASAATALAAARRCAAGEAWEWDGVRFEFLHPAPRTERTSATTCSCVLRVATARRRDAADRRHRARRGISSDCFQGEQCKADVLLVPHHGSRTSRPTAFIAAVAPRWAIVPAGYRNRFGHPHPRGARALSRRRRDRLAHRPGRSGHRGARKRDQAGVRACASQDGIGYNDSADIPQSCGYPATEERSESWPKKGGAVYRVTDVIGTSPNSWEDAATNAVKTASKSLRDLRIAEVTKLDVKVEDGKVTQFRTRLSLSFKYDG